MTIPAGYNIAPNGLFYKASDNSGGYSVAQNGTVNFLGGTLVSATSIGFSEGSRGYWYYTDGSGPYVKQSSGAMYRFIN